MKSLCQALGACIGLAGGAAIAQGSTVGSADLYAGVKTVEVFANMAMQVAPAQSSRYQLAIYRLDAMQNVEALAARFVAPRGLGILDHQRQEARHLAIGDAEADEDGELRHGMS